MIINQVITVRLSHKGSAKAMVKIERPVRMANKLAIRRAPNLSAIIPPPMVPSIPAITAEPPVTATYSVSVHPYRCMKRTFKTGIKNSQKYVNIARMIPIKGALSERALTISLFSGAKSKAC